MAEIFPVRINKYIAQKNRCTRREADTLISAGKVLINGKPAKLGDLGSGDPERPRRYWLLKSEPSEFSFADLLAAPRRRAAWSGIRNFQARNFLREMRPGDGVLFYHSSAEPTGVAGLAGVAGAARPDPTQFARGDPHFDARSRREDPTWWEVEIEAQGASPHFVELGALKANPALERMGVVQRGSRLSVQPVAEAEWREVLRMAGLSSGGSA